MITIGIDISKVKFDVALLKDGKVHSKQFENTSQGFTQLNLWIKRHSVDKCLACMEATGFYGLALAEFLYSHGYDVSIINASCIKAYTHSQLKRHKTDKNDALIIAEYAAKHTLVLWKPAPPALKEIKELYRCSQDLKQHLNQISNHLENKSLPESVQHLWLSLQADLKQRIKAIESKAMEVIITDPSIERDYKNLQTIPGISHTTAWAILAEIPDISSFQSARQLAAFAGLVPCHRTSGSSVKARQRLSKMGSPALRKALYFPAIVAKKYNSVVKRFCANLSLKAKHPMVIICAAMRKLLHLLFGVLKNKEPFNPATI